jgi:hypothetical protein
MDLVLFLLFPIAIGAIYVLRYNNQIGYPSSHTLLPFQSGVLYRQGRPVREVGPGRHSVLAGREKILFVDKRPIQMNVEQRAVALADGSTAIYGFVASAAVCDVMKAIYSSTNYTQMPAFATLCAVRATLNRLDTNQLGIGRAAIEEEITSECRSRLTTAGFELLSFRLTQLAIAAPAPSTA